MVRAGVVAADGRTGSPSLFAGDGLFARLPGYFRESAGQAASGSGDGARRPPEAAAGSQPASWTVMK